MPILPIDISADTDVREVVDDRAARAAMTVLADRHGLGGSLVPCSRGSDLVYAVGESAIVKLAAPTWSAQIDTEAAFLEALEGKLSFATPTLIARGELEGWPYVIMTQLAGQHLDEVWPSLSRSDRLSIAAQIGKLIAELHAIEAAVPAPDWNELTTTHRANMLTTQRARAATEPWLATIDAFVERPYDGDPTDATLHTELLDTHLFVAPDGGHIKISGLIDFADGMRGAPTYEIAGVVEFVFKSEPGLLRCCLEHADWHRPLDSEEGDRLLAAAMLHQFSSLPRMLAAAGIEPSAPPDLPRLRNTLYDLG